MAIVIVTRNKDFRDRLRAYHVLINGEKAEKVKSGCDVEIQLEPGEYEIGLKIDWARSNKVNFSISDGETKVFNCGCNLKSFSLFKVITAITWNLDSYLWLQERST